jgi:drug/metabolite transporter (DMT)-like permease
MNPVFLGLVSALSWAVHDVIAARASKSIGALKTATLVTLLGCFFLSGWIVWNGGLRAFSAEMLWLPLAAGAGIALATVWLFAALTAGSLSLALPIVMSYPVTSLGLGTLAGRHPTVLQFAAAALAIGGTIVVARSEPRDGSAAMTRKAFRRTLGFGALAHFAYAASTFAGQYSATIFDPLEATWIGRIGGSMTIVPVLFLMTADPYRVTPRWLPAVAVMGGLDALALVMINLAATTSYPELAVVAASGAGVISILIVWVMFREQIAGKRWIGIMLTFAGIAMLSGLR